MDNAIEITEGRKGIFFSDRWHAKDRPDCDVQYRCRLQLPLCSFRAALSCSGTLGISLITIKPSEASCCEDHVVVMSFETVSVALCEIKIFFLLRTTRTPARKQVGYLSEIPGTQRYIHSSLFHPVETGCNVIVGSIVDDIEVRR